MNPNIALVLCSIGIAGLFYLDRDKSVRTSPALWLPVIWIWIVGSRPVTVWLGTGVRSVDPNIQVDGSPVDRTIFQLLLVLGVVVLIRRHSQFRNLFTKIWPILLFFSYCLVSVLWSDFPDISVKRWIKAISDLVMILIIVTDAQPSAAFKRVLSRVGFLLLPTSILFIKYFDNLGRAYDLDGTQMNTGVTTNKNVLGVITLVIMLGTVWRILSLVRGKDEPNRWRHLVAQGTLLTFGVSILLLADSATSLFCTTLGSGLMLVTALPVMSRRPARVHAFVSAFLVVGGLALSFGGGDNVVHALGRQTNLTGRTDIWQAVVPVVPNSVLGAGYEGFWLGPRVYRVWAQLPEHMHVNEAHDGYLEAYLNLGWVGVCLIALNFIVGYKNAVAAFRDDPMIGSMLLGYLVAAAFYNITEAGFRLLNPMWIFFLFAVTASVGLTSRTCRAETEAPGEPAGLPEFSRIPSAVAAKR